MARVNPAASQRLRALAAAARWALWILASAWITLGLLWGGLHFLIVPRIAEFRPWLEQQASQRLGIAVRVGDILATSNGLIPSVELRDVRFLDASGREALRLPSVLAALSVRSALGLGFEQLYVAAPELDVHRTRDGRIWVAGFALPDTSGDGSSTADWVFSQTELVVRGGRVRWSDGLRDLPPLDLSDVDMVVRNRGRSHSVRLDADPPAGWGARLTLMGRFQQPLFAGRSGDWRGWSGQLFAQAAQVDLAQLHNYVDLGLGLDPRQGAGSLRAWVDVERAQVTGATADLALKTVTAQLGPGLQPLELVHVSGRLGLQRLQGGQQFTAQALAFETGDGLRWPGGNVQLALMEARAGKPAHGTLSADRLNLAAVGAIASRLPLHPEVHGLFQRLSPEGQVDTLSLGWQGEVASPTGFTAKGRVSDLALAAQAGTGLGIPGLRGAAVDFDLTQDGGRARLDMHDGSVDFPGVFAQAQVPFEELSGDLKWKREGTRLRVEAGKLRFANADAEGEAQIQWHSAETARAAPGPQPGVLDLSGTLARARLAAVPRYLPLDMHKDVRAYLAQALVAGTAGNVKFRLKGDLAQFPFSTAQQGDFQISAQISDASYAYAPALVLSADSPPWPVLTQVFGTLQLDRDRLQIKAARGLVAPGSGLQFGKTEVDISTLYDNPLLTLSAEARGPLSEALAFVNASPVGGWTGRALAHATASGPADYKLRLSLPVEHADKATVQGSITLGGNDFQFAPAVPRLGRAKGVLGFTENSFSLAGVQARALGGDVRLDGALYFGNAAALRGSPGTLRMQGVASAEGLRQASELGLAARLAQFSSGSTAYSVNLSLRAGNPELLVTSSLSGLALNLPAPLGKEAEALLPLRLESTLVRASVLPGARLQDQWQLELGKLASVVYVRDISGPEARVLRGAIALGLGPDEAAPLPAEGVLANVSTTQLDVDSWSAVAARLGASAPGTEAAAPDAETLSYLPSSLALRVRELTVSGRKFNQVLVGGVRDGLVWRGNVDATELNGYVEYRPSSGATPGRVFARLAHLVLGQAVQQDVENLLEQQPASIPALDIVVEDMELRGKKLGRVDIQAVNPGSVVRTSAREWRLNRFNISTPEASLTASGNWALPTPQGAVAAPASQRERRRTALNFKLEVEDSGDLLKRLGMPGVIARGKGLVAGQVSWLGSPFSPDYASMTGGFNVNMESGQFLKADPGIAKLLGVLSLQSLPRRLALDFRDVFSDGFAFDFVRGDVSIEQGLARTNNLQMKGVNAAVLMEGQADIAKETQHLKVVVIPEINVASASLIYSAINPLVGLTTFLANVILRRPLIDANTQEFLIDGSWVDPRITPVTRKAEAPSNPNPNPAKESKP